jgi:hypothetical protein
MPAFCLKTSSESNQQSQEIESIPSPINDDREDGELIGFDQLVASGSEDVAITSNTESRQQRNSRRSGKGKRTATLGDQQSSGRKIAARLYPINKLDRPPCEWRGLSNCGGGQRPILGCMSGVQQARHHGPDKNVANNEEGNVHRICHACHYRWHSKNDPDYDWNATVYPSHNPLPMDEDQRQEALLQDLQYKASKIRKVKDE